MTTAKELDAWSQNMTENTKKKEKKMKWTYQFTSVFSTKIIKIKVEGFCFVLYINLQDKENRRLSGNISDDVPVTVRSLEIIAVHNATSF